MSNENNVALIERVNALSKTNQKNIADQLIAQVVGGEVDPIKAYIQIKGIVECLNIILKDKGVIDSTVTACERFGNDKPEYAGAKMSVTEAGVRYDYSMCGDTKYNELVAQRVELEAQIKAREEFLKHIDGKQTIVDDATGEVMTLYPPARTSTTSLRVAFSK